MTFVEYFDKIKNVNKVPWLSNNAYAKVQLGTLRLYFYFRCAFVVFYGRVIMKKVGLIMGSDSDLPIVNKATAILKELGIPFEAHIYSAHRTPEQVDAFTSSAYDNGFGAIICFAGMAAHLAGAVAARTVLPVIGVPCKSSNLDGLDALLSTVQMPSGIPVATVAIDGGANAALLAAQIIATSDSDLYAKLKAKRVADAQKVLNKDADLLAKL